MSVLQVVNYGDPILRKKCDKVKDFSLTQLKALDKLLDGKATQKDYNILKGGK